MSEASAFIDVMGWARSDFGLNVHVTTCGFEGQVVGAFGVPVAADARLEDVEAADYDALAVPGGFEEYGYFEETCDARFAALVRAFDDSQKLVAGVCAAALAFGKSGILEGRSATTYRLDVGYRQTQFRAFGVQAVDKPVVEDDNIITSSSPQTAAEVAFRLLARLTSEQETALVREAMGY